MFKKVLNKLRERFLSPVLLKLNEHDEILRKLADSNLRTRAMFKQDLSKPIHVLFVCHEPSLWSMFESIFNAMENDPNFSPLVVALPYKHGTLPDGQYKDGGMLEFCKTKKIRVVCGYDKEKNEWINPASIMPDYVFFQTPYALYHQKWSVEDVSMMARICYVPYGTTLFRGEVEDLVHPSSFFRFTHLIFKEDALSKKIFVNKFNNTKWFNEEKVVLCGHTKLDYLASKIDFSGTVWKRGITNDIKRILWTPRWTTAESACHFFEYRNFFIEFCRKHQDIDFVFRPHPLCFQNFLNNGQLTDTELASLEKKYDESLNMTIDRTDNYQDSFLSSDILVSDLSSMMLEFLVTEKPIVYTHRVDLFNELGRKLSRGFYWVKNVNELEETLKMLISGNDPLKKERKDLVETVLFIPKGGVGFKIKEIIKSDFFNGKNCFAKNENCLESR
jgi:hypothetical protein